MMSVQKPSLWRVLSDASRIIRSNSRHFLALSLLFIFPVSLLNAIVHIQTLKPAAAAAPLHSHYGRLLSAVSGKASDPEIPPLDKNQLLFQFLYGLLLLVFNLCSASSVTHSAFHGFHAKTELKLSSALRSALSSFFPLLVTRLVYFVLIAAAVFGFGIFVGLSFLALVLLGFEVKPSSTPFMAVMVAATVLLLVLLIHLTIKWLLVDPVVIAESSYGFQPFERSSKLVKGGRRAALLLMLLFSVLSAILTVIYSTHVVGAAAGICSGAVVVQVVAFAAFSAALTLFIMAAKTVLFVHCKAMNGESSEVPVYDKMGEAYVPLPRDAVDQA